jgi:hypothetical protein
VIEILAFFLNTLLAGDRFSRALSRACIALSALTSNWQAPSVANAPVALYVAKPSDILSNLSAELASDYVIPVDNLRYLAELVFAEFAGLCVFFDPGLLQYLLRGMLTNTNNVGQRDPYRFIIWNIDTNYTRHFSSCSNRPFCK